MPLQIQFIDPAAVDPANPTAKPARRETRRFRLRDEAGTWVGPEINLLPVRELPLVTRVEVRVTGKPDVVATRIQGGYFSRAFDKPVQLAEPRAWGSGRIPNANPLPGESVCELRVTVGYFDATADGRPVGTEKVVSEVCLLFSGAPPETPPELVIRNRELTILVGQSGSQLVTVRNPKDDAPKMTLAYPPSLVAGDDPDAAKIAPAAAELRTAIEAALGRTPSRDDTNPLAHEFRWTFDLRLSDRVKAVLAEIEGGVGIPIEVSLPGVSTLRWLLRLEAQTKVFPGWVVIDFGTTNSTVTLFDTWDYVPFEGLPEEQETYLRAGLSDWLRMTATEAFGKTGKLFEADWSRWRAMAAGGLNAGSPENLPDWLRGDAGTRLHSLVARLESALRLQPEAFRRAAYAKLCKLYRDALRVPPLRRFRLFPIKLDPDTKSETVSSEMEVKAVTTKKRDPDDRWPEIVMGRRAQKGRLEAIGRGDDIPLEQILQRFHPSPKRYFGTDHPGFDIELDGRTERVAVEQLMRAGWQKLLEFADQNRRDEPRFSDGPFRRAVITYPTVAPPSVRQTISKLIRDLGIADVRTDYDEAIASAIFYIMREYNTLPELGLESFKARSRIRSESGWTQNVLVFDIGGGTTDVALIRLTLTEEPVFPPGADRGAGGRYYKLTPKLLSSTGHMQLGGELMTLRIFRLLKALIADKVLTLTQEGKLTCDSAKAVLDAGLPEGATKNNKYQPGWLREVIDTENPDANTPRLRDALNLAERVFPTRWAESSAGRAGRLQAFYALWDFAEDAKKKLGGKVPGADPHAARDPFVLNAKQLTALLEQAEVVHSAKDQKALEIRLTADQMEGAIRKVVQEAVKIADGALQRLPEKETLDWLILSGQSCNLSLVDREIRQKFEKSDGPEPPRFVWNPERVTFLPEYAKLSTAIGACYAENQRRNRFAPADSVKDLRRGINALYFDVNNLFSYLPCSFNIAMDGGNSPVFKVGEELLERHGVDNQDAQRGTARSDWRGGALNIAFYRQDYANGTQRAWGTFDGQELADKLDLTANQWREQVRYQYEVDHRLNVEVLMYRKDRDNPEHPRYRFTGAEPRIDLAAAVTKAAARVPGAVAGSAVPGVLDEEGALQWIIGIGTGAGVTRTVFEPGQKLGPWFHPEGKEAAHAVRGILSKDWVEEFTDEGFVTVWGKGKGSDSWVPLGRLERPGEKPVFRRRYRLTIDEKCFLRVHNGEPNYLESSDPRCLKDMPGWVSRQSLASAKRDADEDRNPFTGKH